MHRTLALMVCLAGRIAAAGPDAGSEHLRLVDAAEGCAEFWRRPANGTPEQQTHDEISVTDALIAESTPRLAQLASRLLAHLDDPSSGPVYRQFFYGSTEKDREVPPRSGYVVGWRIAEAAGKTRSLAQLAAMSPAESRSLVERGLRELARTNAPDGGTGPKTR